mmetsp:Transcript_16144/g.42664  ORF Transcript_16144/g.42664 Transcript_16144/m.42664 type:complete len:311 (+) Transcript_16144:628-1560(+)
MVMASFTALTPSFAIFIWSTLLSCSTLRSSVAVSRFSLRSTIPSASSLISASRSLFLISRELSSRFRSFASFIRKSRSELALASSVSQKPFLVASSVASDSRRSTRSWMSFLTLSKGSVATRCAMSDSSLLLQLAARPARKAAMRACRGLCWPWLRSCASATPCVRRICSSCGKLFSPEPLTASLEMISTAFWIASSSSPRSFWRLSKSAFFVEHSAVVSARYFWSSAMSFEVWARLPSASALTCADSAFEPTFFEISAFACSMLSASCWAICSKACCAVASSLSSSYFFWANSSLSFSSISMTPPDWNS